MSFVVLPVSECVSTPFALRPQHGTPAPPLPVICVKLMMTSRMNSALFSIAHTPIQHSQEIWVLILRGKITGCFYFFAPEQQQTLLFLHEQASSRTLWLKTFPCNHVMRKGGTSERSGLLIQWGWINQKRWFLIDHWFKRKSTAVLVDLTGQLNQAVINEKRLISNWFLVDHWFKQKSTAGFFDSITQLIQPAIKQEWLIWDGF